MFEGAEKKCDLLIDGTQLDLRALPTRFWHQVVGKCEATILSVQHSSHCDAYLLSESSLFVWSERLLLITCGQTTLVDSILFLLQHLPKESVDRLLFQRKNEQFSHLQHTSFTQDVQALRRFIPGQVTVLGAIGSHHTQIFGMGESTFKAKEQIYELLLYSIDEDLCQQLSNPDITKESLRALFKLFDLFPNAIIDDHLFQPQGYSVNAICGDRYLTIHVTPEVEASYIGLETNLPIAAWMEHVLPTFRPASFDVVVYNSVERPNQLQRIPAMYKCVQSECQRICGERIYFAHYEQFAKPNTGVLSTR